MLDIGIPPDEVLDLPDTSRLPVPAPTVGEQDPVQVADQGYVQLPVFVASTAARSASR